MTTAVLAAAAAPGARGPTLDWREVLVEPTGLKAMMPSKPERETRQPFFTGLRFE